MVPSLAARPIASVLALNGAFFPLGFLSRPPAGAHVPFRRSPEIRGAGSKRLLPAGGSAWEGYADLLVQAVLRSATLHVTQPAQQPPNSRLKSHRLYWAVRSHRPNDRSKPATDAGATGSVCCGPARAGGESGEGVTPSAVTSFSWRAKALRHTSRPGARARRPAQAADPYAHLQSR